MKILDIAINDLKRSFRSTFAIGMMVVAPLLLTGLIYAAFGGKSGGDVSISATKVGVVNADSLPSGHALREPLGASIRSLFFADNVKSLIAAIDYPDEPAARAAVNRQEIGVAVIIPANFSVQFLNGAPNNQIVIVSDPTLNFGASIVKNMVSTIIDGANGNAIAVKTLLERSQTYNIMPDPVKFSSWVASYITWYTNFQSDLNQNSERSALVQIAPATGETKQADPLAQMMGMVMTGQMIFFAFFTAAYAMMSILREAEEGTLARLFTTPTDRTNILTGKFLAVFITVVIQGLVLMVIGHFAFGINWGQPLNVAMAFLGQVVAASGLGVLLISFVKTTKQGGPVLGGGLTAFGMLGGLFTTNIPGGMPAAFTMLGNFVPQGWVLKGWQMTLNGQPASDQLVPLGVVLAMGVVMFAIGNWMFHRRYA
jgi:ABC-2 type transport system permease protein